MQMFNVRLKTDGSILIFHRKLKLILAKNEERKKKNSQRVCE